MTNGPFIYDDAIVFVAPAGTLQPQTREEVYDPDGPWFLAHPIVPDVPPEDQRA